MGIYELTLDPDIDSARWIDAAVEFYQMSYSFREITPEEQDTLKRNSIAVYEAMPDEYKTGVHLLREGAAHCGEDIYIVDGRLTHNVWAHCGNEGCDSPVLGREGAPEIENSTRKGRRRLKCWCPKCNDWTIGIFVGDAQA